MASSLLLTLTVLPATYAWGNLGHATIGSIAQNYLHDDTVTWAQGILGNTSDTYLASVASWADDYRSTTAGKFSAPFHFIDAEDNPPSLCNVDFERDCGPSGCVVSALANYTQRVNDQSLPASERQQALKFLIHFVGDITQPLHDEAYMLGANNVSVTFDGHSNDNLHSIWDTWMPEKLIGGHAISQAVAWATNLTTEIQSGIYANQAASWIEGDTATDVITTATRWATDANAFVCSKVMPQGSAALQTADLYPSYYDSVIDTIELQIAKGGYRLGNWLNEVYTLSQGQTQPTSPGNGTSGCASSRVRRANVAVARNPGFEFLPPLRPLSKAKLARAAVGWGCAHEH